MRILLTKKEFDWLQANYNDLIHSAKKSDYSELHEVIFMENVGADLIWLLSKWYSWGVTIETINKK